jgi:quercetin dioxygenase-like cupin family protein
MPSWVRITASPVPNRSGGARGSLRFPTKVPPPALACQILVVVQMKKIRPSKMKWQDTDYGYFRKILMSVSNRAGKVCRVQFIFIPPNNTVRPHYHRGQTESEYVLTGSGTVRSGKQIIRLRPGVMFIVTPDELHEVKSGKKGLLLFVTKANYSDDTEWFE